MIPPFFCFYVINYFHKFNLNIRHWTHEACEAATWTPSGSGFSPDPGQSCDNQWKECLVLYMLHDTSKFYCFMSLTTSTNSNWTYVIFHEHRFQKSYMRSPTRRPFCFILSLVLLVQACGIYQKKGFLALYNIGVTFIYRKTPSKGRKSIKTHNLRRPSWI